jgi:hypothetical protein
MKVLALVIPRGIHLHVLGEGGLAEYDPVELIKKRAVLYDVPGSFKNCHPHTILIYCKNCLKAGQCVMIGQKLEAKLLELKGEGNGPH